MAKRSPRVSVLLYWFCVGIAAVILAVLFIRGLDLRPPARFQSQYPPADVLPVMGLSDDSVFNKGDAEALDAFPGIGEVLAQRIIELRPVIGGYRIPEDLTLVKGIGEKTLQKMLDVLTEPLVELQEASD